MELIGWSNCPKCKDTECVELTESVYSGDLKYDDGTPQPTIHVMVKCLNCDFSNWWWYYESDRPLWYEVEE